MYIFFIFYVIIGLIICFLVSIWIRRLRSRSRMDRIMKLILEEASTYERGYVSNLYAVDQQISNNIIKLMVEAKE